MWVGYWVLMNGTAWNALAPADQKIVEDAFNAQALVQREANEKLEASLEAKLKAQNMEFYQPDLAAFRSALAKSSFYKDWKAKFDPALWAALEKVTGPLG